MVLSATAPASAAEAGATCASGVTTGWRLPVQQRYVITSGFGMRTDPITHQYRLHAGVDLAMLPGPGPVVAAAAGTVVRSGPYGGLGNEVTLQNADGVQTLYGHMSQIDPSIRAGVQVAAGQVLGTEGSTGQSTGPHLHFEVHVNGSPVNPVAFMASHGAPLTGAAPSGSGVSTGVALPAAGAPRQNSLSQQPLTVPSDIMNLYVAAGQKYGVPWALLAGVGMEETGQGRNNHESTAGALGLMQFLPSTFARYGVDGNGDGKADILNDADSVYSAANALRAFGAANGADGVRQALYSYNPAQWYVNDVLYYANSYNGAGSSCTSAASGQLGAAVSWAEGRVGQSYSFGADGPSAWDSSSFVQAAYAKSGVKIPRTAQAQRDWMAAGHGVRVQPGDEQPGDLIFENSYLGPDKIGFVMIVTDTSADRGVAARNPQLGVAHVSYADAAQSKHIFEIWRPKASTRGTAGH